MIRTTTKLFAFFSSKNTESRWGYAQNKFSGSTVNKTANSYAITLQYNQSQTTYKEEQKVIEDFDRAKDKAFEEGFSRGELDGYNKGYLEGLERGFIYGKDAGHVKGYSNGKFDGLKKGFANGKKIGYVNGYSNGTSNGQKIGYNLGQKAGFRAGVRSSAIYIAAAFGLYSLFSQIVYGQK